MNIVAPKIRQSRWLDLYSGSGALGCEALHRGACKVVAVEKDKNTASLCRENLNQSQKDCYQKTIVKVHRHEVLKWLSNCNNKEKFDIIYIDPPYTNKDYNEILNLIWYMEFLDSNGIIIFEHCSNDSIIPSKFWNVLKRKHYGLTSLLLINHQLHSRFFYTDSKQQQTIP